MEKGEEPKTDKEQLYSSSSASDAVPNSQECEGRDMAREMTLSMGKPGEKGVASLAFEFPKVEVSKMNVACTATVSRIFDEEAIRYETA